MCGIAGVFGNPDAKVLVEEGLKKLKERGRDSSGVYGKGENFLGHVLHAVVNTVKQPIRNEGVLSSNCEIYNWKELSKKYKIKARNDSELLLRLLDAKGLKVLDELRGVYAFAYWKGDTVTVARDIIGVKPLWYSLKNGFSIASEKKAIGKRDGIYEINPRKILIYNVENRKVRWRDRKFFNVKPTIRENRLRDLLEEAVRIRIPSGKSGLKSGLLFSGGIDSAVIAKILKDSGHDFICYTAAASEESADLAGAKEAAKELGLRLKYKIVEAGEVPRYLEKVVPLIEDSNVIKVGVALPLYIASELARKDGVKVIFSGSGADEVFGGYARYKQSRQLNKDCYSDILRIYERNTYRDDVVTMNNNLELRVPFLDLKVVEYGLRLSEDLKIKDGVEKFILRKVALELGISKELSDRKKKAAQYGSGFDKAVAKLAKKSGYKTKSAYLRKFYAPHNVRLGALVSSGKDGLYAAYTMVKQNYSIGCLITMKSSNPDSYMFHTPNVHITELQAKAMEVPIIVQETRGEKEDELEDLKKALVKAKTLGVQGIVSGALYSNYQRERIEKLCDKLGLKVFSPLWHIDQEKEMRSLLKEGFEIWFSSVAAEGLDKSWLGRRITSEDVDKLVELNKKIGMNIAGEGGEFESLVLNCPLFKKKIEILEFDVKEDHNTARLTVMNAVLK